MSGDEVFALIFCVVIGLFGWLRWLVGLMTVKPLVFSRGTRELAILTPLCSAGIMLFVLCFWAAHDVRSDLTYILFYLAMWFGWTGALLLCLALFGLNSRDDWFERQNPAAALACGGALVGVSLAFAGGNIGDGPGWWVVVFSSGLATATLLLLWMLGNAFSHVEEAVTIDRDSAAGWRVLGFFVGGGLVVGRAAAGNWISATTTFTDFLTKGWPVLLLWAAAVGMDVMLRPSPASPTRPAIACGLLPALLLIVLGLTAAVQQGAW
jgi:uncharacterized membrane protein YjfL (UPF0719 family)